MCVCVCVDCGILRQEILMYKLQIQFVNAEVVLACITAHKPLSTDQKFRSNTVTENSIASIHRHFKCTPKLKRVIYYFHFTKKTNKK